MIEIRHLHRTFEVGGQPVHALVDANLEIPDGQYVSIMGPSGSGKSTLLKIIGLLDRPSSGTYLLDGQEVTALHEEERARIRRERVGFVFQFFHLIPRMTAAQNIELPLTLAGVAPRVRRERVDAQLSAFGLGDRAEHRPDELSGGQRQRVAIARATITDPTVILADEPTGNLDRATGVEVMRILEGLHARGVSILLVTHDPELGSSAERQLRMADGRIVEDIQRPA